MQLKTLTLVCAVLFSAVAWGQDETVENEQIAWITIEEAYAKTLADAQPKKIFIDVYTDWCGWCKVMDRKTFAKPEVARYMNARYYMVKFNAEQREDVEILGNTFKFIERGRGGYHELAALLLQGQLSYPTVVFMNHKFEIISPVPGFHEAGEFLNIARFFGDDIYKTTSWEDYLAGL